MLIKLNFYDYELHEFHGKYITLLRLGGSSWDKTLKLRFVSQTKPSKATWLGLKCEIKTLPVSCRSEMWIMSRLVLSRSSKYFKIALALRTRANLRSFKNSLVHVISKLHCNHAITCISKRYFYNIHRFETIFIMKLTSIDDFFICNALICSTSVWTLDID